MNYLGCSLDQVKNLDMELFKWLGVRAPLRKDSTGERIKKKDSSNQQIMILCEKSGPALKLVFILPNTLCVFPINSH